MRRERFEALVGEALQTIPPRFRSHLGNIAIIVEDRPSRELLADMEVGPDDTLLGLYHGLPLTERPWGYGNALPDRITLFQQPIEDECDTDDEVVVTIGETLIHEVGHYFGMSEDEIMDIEERYWRKHLGDDDPSEEESGA